MFAKNEVYFPNDEKISLNERRVFFKINCENKSNIKLKLKTLVFCLKFNRILLP
jgi:hypothetical protein